MRVSKSAFSFSDSTLSSPAKQPEPMQVFPWTALVERLAGGCVDSDLRLGGIGTLSTKLPPSTQRCPDCTSGLAGGPVSPVAESLARPGRGTARNSYA